jgi:hypothetical protein
MKTILFGVFFILSVSSHSEEKVIYEYKKYERFDLGNLEVQGEIIAPGDISVRQRKRKKIRSTIYERTDYYDVIKKEIKFFR